jgi:hypothetical protein
MRSAAKRCVYVLQKIRKEWNIVIITQRRSDALRNTDTPRHRKPFLRLLRLAYSGRLGAALEYRGHAASVRPEEPRRIKLVRTVVEGGKRASNPRALVELFGSNLAYIGMNQTLA